ncbi:MAG: hypothetical protein K6D94_03330 [Clostridiales bacterium]|nr:hypothetical protein [Clostridiales bacterium]
MKKTALLLFSALIAALTSACLSLASFAEEQVTLRTGEEPPLFMAVGEFREYNRLSVVEALDIVMPEQSSDYTTAYYVEVLGYTGDFTMKIWSPTGGEVYIQDGIYWDEIPTHMEDGYITFSLASGTMIAYASGSPLRTVYVIVGVVLIAAIAVGGSAVLVYGTGSRLEKLKRRLNIGGGGGTSDGGGGT